VIARNGAFVFFSAIKITLVLAKAPVTAFAIVVSGESALAAVALVVLYARQSERILAWRFDRTRAMGLMRDGWPLLVAYMAYLIYAKIDQVMIGSMLGNQAVGIYSASSKISEIPVAVMLIVSASLFPKLVALYENDRERFFKWYSDITGALTWGALFLCLFLFLFGNHLVRLLFGPPFQEAASILNYQAVGLIFMFNGTFRSAFLTISSHQKILSATTVFSALFNVGLNFFLIPRFGIYGAAAAGVCVQALSLMLLNAATRQTWRIFRIQLVGLLLLPFLYRVLTRKHDPISTVP